MRWAPQANAHLRKWKLLIVDSGSRKLIDNVVKEDEILSEKITSAWVPREGCEHIAYAKADMLEAIEPIEGKREPEREMDAIYLLTPEAHIVDCLLADLQHRRYRSASVLWTGCQ